jgi:hypothetical protein
LNRNREQEELLAEKKWDEVENKSRFESADDEKGGKVFDRIANVVAEKHGKFDYYQKNQQSDQMNLDDDFNENPEKSHRNLIENIKQNAKD